jgi:hypothetical protein
MSNGAREAAVTIACEVALGMFRDERGVEISLPNGRKIAALVDKNDVHVSQDPKPGETVPGRLRVSVVEPLEDGVLVDLPRPSFSDGQRVRVPRDLLEGAPA